MKWISIYLLLALLSVHSIMATEALYQNNSVLQYAIPGNPPPTIDATGFDNQNIFSVSQFAYGPQTYYYEPWNTLFYTNSGTMIVNSPNTTNGIIFFTFGTGAFAVGFQFDTLTTNVNPHTMAGTFYNPGTIRCASVLDGNNIFFIYNLFGGDQLYSLSSYGKCLVSATNIVNPGTIDVSVGGLVKMDGQNIDLSFGVLTNEALLDYTGLFNSVGLSSVGAVGTDTNADWNPGLDLTADHAYSSFVPIPPFYLNLTNSTSYFDVVQAAPSNNIIRAVFVQNDSINAPYRVFIDTPNVSRLGFEFGAAHVEWDGYYVDPATGQNITNYLYLTDDYVFGASTNVLVINGVPDNFSFISSPTPLLINPTPSGFIENVFTNVYMTNPYAYFNAQLIASSISTNVSAINPHGTITNLPGRVEINADNQLSLANTIITGQNYLSLNAPRQFNGSAGAHITSPYSDINLGVTNGSMTVSNLLTGSIPTWSGGIQAWSTRWVEVDDGVTNDYRVLLVGSQLTPTSIPWVKDLKLHATNSVVLNDTLNVYNSAYTDAQRLTIATNGLGNGATSLEGELNWHSTATFGKAQLPNVRWLTNNGALRMRNLGQFVGSSNYVSVVPAVAAMAATGMLSENNTNQNVAVNDTVTIGSFTYTFVSSIANTVANQVKIAASFDGSMNNLIAAINQAAGAGTVYSTNTSANSIVSAAALTNHSFMVTARIAGSAWNSFPTTTTSTNLTWNSNSTLSGGSDYVAATTNSVTVPAPYHQYINNGLIMDQGLIVWAQNFENTGIISNGVGSFNLDSLTTTLTNGSITAGSDIIIAADTLITSNLVLQAGRSLSLAVTNLLTDSALTNGNIWTVQSTNGSGGNGLIMLAKPAMGDLLGTTITNFVPGPNRQTVNVWAGQDRGASVDGYTNNAAVGRLVLDALGTKSQFKFYAAGTNNALYVDSLEFKDYMTNGINNSFDFSENLSINPNLTIYFAQATVGGVSIAAKIDAASKSGKNNGRLLWVPTYAGHFSSVDLVYPDGSTNTVNAALAGSSTIDSDGDGIPNASDPTPFFTGSQVNLNIAMTNLPPQSVVITWNSIPGSTNYVSYKTNSTSQTWLTLTNFVSPSAIPPVGGWPIFNTVYDTVNPAQTRFYNVTVIPNSTLLLYGQ